VTRGRAAWADRGRPAPPQAFDRKYRKDALAYLDGLPQLAHYGVVAAYVRQHAARGSVLDVGCGHGRLAWLLRHAPLARYHGIDFSPEAIRRARRRAGPRMRFDVADFDTWRPRARYSAIVFCESVNYAARPVATLRRFAHALRPGGVLIVSLFRVPRPGAFWRRFWRAVAGHFDTVDATVVSNRAGETWDVRMLRPRP
jgi:SAM-dependent methyltransferase